MKNTINKQAETLKKSIDSVSQSSKESIKTLIESNSKQFDSALETNKKTFDSISKMLYEKEMDPTIVSAFKSTFGKGIKMSEDVIDSIIDSHTTRIDLTIDFTTKFMELVKNEDLNTKEGVDKLVELVKENFDKSSELSMGNMEKIVNIYNDHLNLALNFNKKFGENINSQITSMFKLQKKNIDSFFAMDMVTEWWKNVSEEKSKA
ncbi:MAG TPA: hypothetical protein VK890_08525 [Bacteroidia bacterium]|jgi:hypothetical protein|nr:hypothetical protein [Bacteroidia bacterium]